MTAYALAWSVAGMGAFIGAVHRIAARLDNHYVLVAGALSSDPPRARASGRELSLDPMRSYGSYTEMFAAECGRADGIEVVTIVTPNHMHHPVARAALEAGLHVICDKPLATSATEADELVRLAADAQRIFAVTYNYTGYPMVRQARAMVARGDIGALRVVQVEYAQAWLAGPLESSGQRQALWRTDPARSGPGGAIGDIGSHAFHLACFVTGRVPHQILGDLSTFVPGRRVDDNAHMLLRFTDGARGTLWASQVAHGNENALRLRIYGQDGGLEWSQEEPDRLWFTPSEQPRRLLTRGGPRNGCRGGPGCPPARGSPGGLSGRFRDDLCRRRPRHPRGSWRHNNGSRRCISLCRGRRAWRPIHRGVRDVVDRRRTLD